jgi:hypothetical protein
LELVMGMAFVDDRWVMISLAASAEVLKEGMDRLVRQFGIMNPACKTALFLV